MTPSQSRCVEHTFLLHAVGLGPSAAKREPLQQLLDSGVNWKELLGRARWHRVLIPLYRTLVDAVEADIPVDVLEWLHRHYEETLSKNFRSTGRLTQILERFARAGVGVLTFKGPALAVMAYGNVGLREFSDLDLLVRPPDVQHAHALLRELGFEPRVSLDAAALASFVTIENALEFRRPSDNQMVELHWALTPKSFPFRLDHDAVWHSARVVTVAGRAVPTLGAEHLLLFLCVHAAKHSWESLGWIMDIARLMDGMPIDDERLLALAESSGTRRILLLGLALAHELLHAPVSPAMLARIRTSPRVQVLVADLARHLAAERRALMASRKRMALHWRMRERWRDRVSFGVHLALTPTVRDLEAVKLPASLSMLHRPMRPFRLMRDFAGRSRQS